METKIIIALSIKIKFTNLKENLESQEYWIFEQFSIPAISNLEQYGIIPDIFQIENIQNNSVHFRKLQKQDDSGKIEILKNSDTIRFFYFLFYSNEPLI